MLAYILGDFFTHSSGHPGSSVAQTHTTTEWFPDQKRFEDLEKDMSRRRYVPRDRFYETPFRPKNKFSSSNYGPFSIQKQQI
jgi:hypothetical protein